MCEVTSRNFSEERDLVIEKIRGCSFVAVDTEFTALRVCDDTETCSLFDDGADRYKKLRENAARGAIINQVGLAIFTRYGRGGDGPDEYVCDAYTFYVCPHSHFGGHDPAFVLKPSSIEFLAQNNFDFNKFLREGVPYLNDEGEERLQQVLRDQVASKGIEMKNVALGDQEMIREKACQVSEWANSCHAKTARNLKRTEIVYEGSCPSTWYLLHRAIRSAHPYVWTSENSMFGSHIDVDIVSKKERTALEKSDTLDKRLVECSLGFTVIYRELLASKKPIVGHNCFGDFVKMTHQFGSELPSSYADFKKIFTAQFSGGVYDTKLIGFELKRSFENIGSNHAEKFESTQLQTLMESLDPANSTRFSDLPFSPKITLGPGTKSYETSVRPHEAGYDALMTGFVFLKAAHYSASLNYKTLRPLHFKEHLHCLRKFRNKLNVARAAIKLIDLDSKVDPKAIRPAQLYVRGRRPNGGAHFQNLIAHKLSSFGSVDVKLLAGTFEGLTVAAAPANEAIVAVGNQKTAHDILLAFRDDGDLLVTNYSAYKRQQLLKYTLGLCTLTATIFVPICALAMRRRF